MKKYVTHYTSMQNKEYKASASKDVLAIFRYCLFLTTKLLNFFPNTNGFPLRFNNTSNNTFSFHSLKIDNENISEFQNRFLFDICTYTHYNFEALYNEFFLISLNELDMCVRNNVIFNLHDFSNSEIIEFLEKKCLNKFSHTILPIKELFTKYYNNPSTHYGLIFHNDLFDQIHQAEYEDLFHNIYSPSSLARLAYTPLSCQNFRDNRNISRYISQYKKLHHLLSIGTRTQTFLQDSRTYFTNPFLAKFCYDILIQSPNKLPFLVNDSDISAEIKLSTSLKNFIRFYDNCSITYTDTVSTNTFDYYFKKEYSLGALSLYKILLQANKDKKEISLDTLTRLQKLPAVFSRILLVDYLIENPNQIENYYNYFFTMHKLLFLMIYQLNNGDISQCEQVTRHTINSFTSITLENNLDNSASSNIRYEYPYAHCILEQMQTNISTLLNEKEIHSLVSNLHMVTSISLKKYLSNSFPNCSINFT